MIIYYCKVDTLDIYAMMDYQHLTVTIVDGLVGS